MKRLYWLLIVGGLASAGAIGGWLYFANRAQGQAGGTAAAVQTAQVSTVTEVSSVESSGSVAPLQQESLAWKTTGTVAAVNVKVGDRVHKGDVLMSLDPASASQSILQAQIDLIAARKALDNLLHPGASTIATAKQAAADAEQTLKDAEQSLKYVENPLGQSLYDSLSDAKLALDTAQANQNLARVGADASSVKTTLDDMNLAYSRLQRARTAMDDCNDISCGERVQRENELNEATKAYQKNYDAYQTAVLQYNTTVANQSDDVRTAQADYDQAVANLNAAKAGPDALKVKTYTAAVEVARADLADKQTTLDNLLKGGDPDDVATAEANVLSAQATVDTLTLKAPFDGEVLEVDYLPGDTASTADTAVVLANRTQMHVDVAVDEADISQVAAGNTSTLTFDSLPDLSLAGRVSEVIPYGITEQGLVKYTVRIQMDNVTPKVLIGMTASATIVTGTTEGVLAVPFNAVQLDGTQEYVNRVGADGQVEKVDVVSGSEQGDLIVVTGSLRAGDTVQVPAAKTTTTTTNGGPFGGGG